MSRVYVKISESDFRDKIEEAMEFYRANYSFSDKIEKDIAKVEFDRENLDHIESFAGYPSGYQDLGDDLKVQFISAGGDWEMPICFILYWDGKQLRGYIPKDGNAYNKKHKIAYSNDSPGDPVDSDGDYDETAVENEVNRDLIIEDIRERLKLSI